MITAYGLSDLPPELINLIYNFCSIRDLINISCCSKHCYDSVKYLLWDTVELPLWLLAQESLSNINLENFRLTTRLSLRSHGYKTLQRFDWSSAVHNYKTLLEYCDNERLVSLEIDGLINDRGLLMTCSILSNLQEISLFNCKDITDVGWSILGSLPCLKKLWLTGCCINDSGVEKLAEFGILLHDFRLIKCSKITEKCLKHINGLIRLMNLKINKRESSFNTTNEGLKSLTSAVSLTMDLEESRLTDQSLMYISHLRALRSLVVDGYNNNITDIGVFYISKLTILESLHLINCTEITDYCLSHVTNSLVGLKDLNISGCTSIQDGGLNHISALTSLKYLNISYCKSISDTGIQYLTKLSSSLRKLNIANCCQVTDIGMSYVRMLSELIDLDVSYCIKISDIGLHQISKLGSMTHLNISGCNRVTDSGLSHLAGLAFLCKLDLNYCSLVSDVGIYRIKKVKSLKILNIDNCSNVTVVPRLCI